MTMITGINHFVGHIYNYSPPELPFRAGSGIPPISASGIHGANHLGGPNYSARLSSVLQDSRAITDVGIIGAELLMFRRRFSRAAFQRNPVSFSSLQNRYALEVSTAGQGVLDQAFDACCKPVLHFPIKVLVLGDITVGNRSYCR